jgi:hypothetical protein
MTNAIRIAIIATASTVGAAVIGTIGYVAGKHQATKQILAKTEAELLSMREQGKKAETELRA